MFPIPFDWEIHRDCESFAVVEIRKRQFPSFLAYMDMRLCVLGPPMQEPTWGLAYN